MKGSIIFMVALVLLLGGVLVALVLPELDVLSDVDDPAPERTDTVTPLEGSSASAMSGVGVNELFSRGRSLDEAKRIAAEAGKPVLVYATADWCPPCRVMKRTTFTDAQVQETIQERTVPMYLDLTVRSASTPEAAISRELGVRGIPVLILLRDGEVISRRAGIVPAEDLIEWINLHSRA